MRLACCDFVAPVGLLRLRRVCEIVRFSFSGVSTGSLFLFIQFFSFDFSELNMVSRGVVGLNLF